MPKFFKKVSNSANNMFTKIDKGASSFFTKTAPNIGNKIGSNIQNIGDKVAGVGKQAGNFLEKNSAILGDVAGGVAIASGFGAPLGASLIGAGNIGAQMGQRLKQGSQEIRNASNRTGSLLQSQVQNASNKAMNLKNNLTNHNLTLVGPFTFRSENITVDADNVGWSVQTVAVPGQLQTLSPLNSL